MKTIAIALCVGALALTGCSSEKDARKAAEANGFTDIVVEGWAGPFQCGDDWNATKFTATNSQGKRVEGVACSGLFFKNTTIRW